MLLKECQRSLQAWLRPPWSQFYHRRSEENIIIGIYVGYSGIISDIFYFLYYMGIPSKTTQLKITAMPYIYSKQ